jgi:hypothetical protein
VTDPPPHLSPKGEGPRTGKKSELIVIGWNSYLAYLNTQKTDEHPSAPEEVLVGSFKEGI